MALVSPTTGQWNLFGVNIPDIGLSEALGWGQSNPNVDQAMSNSLVSPLPNAGAGAQSYSTQNVTQSTANSGGGTSNPVQQTQQPSQPSGPSGEDQLRSQLDSIFNPVFSALSEQENTLNQNYGTVKQDIGANYQQSANTLAQQNKEGVQGAEQQQTQAGQTKTDALTAATRLFDELSRGGQQRFGGASSAGEAYGALTAVEQQRRQGTIEKAYMGAVQQINTYKQNLNDKYTLAVQDLETQKNGALNQAQRDFNDALQQINSAKNQAQSDKASATMNTLQDYRNKVYTINQQSLQFAQQLAANNQMTMKAVDDYTAKVQASLSSGQVIGTNFASQATGASGQTKLGIGAGQTTPVTQQYTGTVTPTTKKYDIYGNEIA